MSERLSVDCKVRVQILNISVSRGGRNHSELDKN